MPDNVNVGSIHDEDDTPRVPLDTSRDFVPGQMQTIIGGDPVCASSVSSYSAAAAIPTTTMADTGWTGDADCVCILQEFLEVAGVLSSTEDVMSIFEILVSPNHLRLSSQIRTRHRHLLLLPLLLLVHELVLLG